MRKPSIRRVGPALLLLYGIVPFVFGYIVLREWTAESAVLVICGAMFLLGGATMLSSALWLLAGVGRLRAPLWTGGFASILSAGVMVGSSLGHVLPCKGPD